MKRPRTNGLESTVENTPLENLPKDFNEQEIVEIIRLKAEENYNLINTQQEIESDGPCAIAQARTA